MPNTIYKDENSKPVVCSWNFDSIIEKLTKKLEEQKAKEKEIPTTAGR